MAWYKALVQIMRWFIISFPLFFLMGVVWSRNCRVGIFIGIMNGKVESL
jgi:hypothetical protein